ncbi:MAG: response regulator [Candidatus Riflebacteria bacterium]|nr:response regulator [Candidatus Riflebacteria bacterium]
MQKLRILLVDDDDAFCRMTKTLLVGLGYCVDDASSGTEALALLDKNSYNLMLTDIEMPGMNGWTLIEKANERRDCINMAILVMSGAFTEIETNSVPILPKPFDMTGLIHAIIDTLNKKKRLIYFADSGRRFKDIFM